jgi:tetratricopeptide (TPR) repeat protein
MADRSVERLLSDVTFALEQGLSARDLVPMLRNLAKKAEPGSDISRFARLCLSQQLLASDPFRSASMCRALTQEDAADDEAFGLYGLSLMILGHYRLARKALERACELAPEHPGHAHNLGHLLDAGLNRPLSAIPWLKRAFDAASEVPEIASSYAHALFGAGRKQQAHDLLKSHANMDEPTISVTLTQWANGETSPAVPIKPET